MAKILIIDDEVKVREIVKKYAAYDHHIVFEAKDGVEALNMIEAECFDIIILDVMLPQFDGVSLLKELRKNNIKVPTIMLTAKAEESAMIEAFQAGTDDYVVKPFSPLVLMLRVRAILNRTKTSDNEICKYVYKKLKIDFVSRKVTINGKEINITPKEYVLIEYLIKNANMAIPRDKIISAVWGEGYTGDKRTLDAHIKLLRKHLGEYQSLITTIRGIGYRFDKIK